MLNPTNTVINKRQSVWSVIYSGSPHYRLGLRIISATEDEPKSVMCDKWDLQTDMVGALAVFPFSLIEEEGAAHVGNSVPAEHRDEFIQMAALWLRLTQLCHFASECATEIGEAQFSEAEREALDEVLL